MSFRIRKAQRVDTWVLSMAAWWSRDQLLTQEKSEVESEDESLESEVESEVDKENSCRLTKEEVAELRRPPLGGGEIGKPTLSAQSPAKSLTPPPLVPPCPVNTSTYWRFDEITNPILQPQVFRHHQLPATSQNVVERLGLPRSADKAELSTLYEDSEKGRLLRQDCLQPRYLQIRDCRVSSCLCRLCPHKKWVPPQWFEDHLAAAHGIVSYEDAEDNKAVLALPPPSAVFCQNLVKGLKRYHCQCPHCERWIQLGLPESSVRGGGVNMSNEDRQKMGLYTNYYMHYMKCDVI